MRPLAGLTLLLALGCGGAASQSSGDDGFVPLFNGHDLSGWVRVNCAPEPFKASDGLIAAPRDADRLAVVVDRRRPCRARSCRAP